MQRSAAIRLERAIRDVSRRQSASVEELLEGSARADRIGTVGGMDDDTGEWAGYGLVAFTTLREGFRVAA